LGQHRFTFALFTTIVAGFIELSYWRWVRPFRELFADIRIELPPPTQATFDYGWTAGALALVALALLASRPRPSLLIPFGLAFGWTVAVTLFVGMPALQLARALGS
jgi:hypothetical protein